MPLEYIESWIKESLNKRYSPESVKESLKQSEYNPSIVDEILRSQKFVTKNKTQKSPEVREIKSRPTVVTLLAILFILSGSLSVIMDIGMIALSNIFLTSILTLSGFDFISGILMTIAGILGFVGGVGLWKLRWWGLFASIISLVIEVIAFLYIKSYILIVINVALVYYLYRNRNIFD